MSYRPKHTHTHSGPRCRRFSRIRP
jgi:hypothetical protein